MGDAHSSDRRSLRRQKELFQALAEIASDWFWETDADHVYTWFSDNVSQHTGLSAEWHIGKSRLELLATATDQEALREHRAVLARHEPFSDVEICRDGPDGRVWVRSSGIPLHDEQGRFEGYLGTGRNITAIKRQEERIQYLASHDVLTGLANRVTLEAALKDRLAAMADGGAPPALVLIDLDRFKQVNDRFGHDAGDALLRAIGSRLRSAMASEHEIAARLGGDEFAILMDLSPALPRPGRRLHALMARLQLPLVHNDHRIEPGVSIGIAMAPRDGNDLKSLHKSADLALYDAKHSGRGQWVEFEAPMAVRASAQAALDEALRHAIEGEEFSLDFLPVIAGEDHRPLEFEALLRWEHPDRGRLMPADFLPAIRASGLLGRVTLLVAERLLARAARWRVEDTSCRLAFNIGADRVGSETLLADIMEVLDRSRLPGRTLAIDLVEADLGCFDRGVLTCGLEALSERGVKITLDGFGSGLGSLENLLTLPIDTLKLDRLLVQGIETDPRRQAVVRGVLDLGRRCGVKVVAKHVESQAQCRWLLDQGCHAVQGFLFGRPQGEAVMPGWLHGSPAAARGLAPSEPALGTPLVGRQPA